MDLDEADGVTSRVTVFAAMQKQQRAKAGMKPPKAGGTRKGTGFPPPFPNRSRKDSFPPNL